MVTVEPVLRVTDGAPRGVLVWRWPATVNALSSAAVGGGASRPDWVINVGVNSGYGRTDLTDHTTEIAAELGLAGDGVALFTAADVARPARSAAGGVTVHATVGVSHPTWAAGHRNLCAEEAATATEPSRVDPTSGESAIPGGAPPPGTINLVIQVPVALHGGAGINAVITATEAKTQALLEAGVEGTGTATDAVVVVWPLAAEHAERFAGPRSPWGERIARCVHAAVREGLAT